MLGSKIDNYNKQRDIEMEEGGIKIVYDTSKLMRDEE